jgi:lycopene cyclase domain-containing protein
MNFGTYSYTATVLIFCSLAFSLYLVGLLLRRKSAILSTGDWEAVLWTIVIMTIITSPMEYVALAWQTWTYNPEKTFDTTFLGAEVETYLFIILVSLVVSIATLVYANREDRKRNTITNS